MIMIMGGNRAPLKQYNVGVPSIATLNFLLKRVWVSEIFYPARTPFRGLRRWQDIFWQGCIYDNNCAASRFRE